MDGRTLAAFAAGGAVGTCLAALIYSRSNQQNERTIGGGAVSSPQKPAAGDWANGEPVRQRSPVVSPPAAPGADDEIIAEQFTRNVQFFGGEAQQRVAGSFVIVVGLGGVGSHCAHMLLRSAGAFTRYHFRST